MRRMLLDGSAYRWLEEPLYQRKMRAYERELKAALEEKTQEAA